MTIKSVTQIIETVCNRMCNPEYCKKWEQCMELNELGNNPIADVCPLNLLNGEDEEYGV